MLFSQKKYTLGFLEGVFKNYRTRHTNSTCSNSSEAMHEQIA